jgi:hypothetical protein
MTVPETQTIPTTFNYCPRSAGTEHHKTHSTFEKASCGKCTWVSID